MRRLGVLFLLLSVLGIAAYREVLLQAQIIWGNLDKSHSSPRVLVVYEQGVGEDEWGQRLLAGGAGAGIDVVLVRSRYPGKRRWMCRKLIGRHPVNVVASRFAPDAVILLQHKCPFIKGYPNYSVLSTWDEYYLADKYWDASVLTKVNGILYAAKDLPAVREWLRLQGVKFNGLRWLPSTPARSYVQSDGKRLFYCGGNWDKRRSSRPHIELGRWLDVCGWADIYGPAKAWSHTPNSYRGVIPYDGVSLVNTVHEAGVALLMHSQEHRKAQAPTGRIFEAAAGSAVIISDRHPWIEEAFGDSVLYIDAPEDGLAMYEDIKEKMEWIWAHPQEAASKAKKSNQIFNERYSVEQQWKNFWAFHQRSQV